MSKSLTQRRLQELLELRHDGRFYWKVNRGGTKAGTRAGRTLHGETRIGVDGTDYNEKKLKVLWHYGFLPAKRVMNVVPVAPVETLEELFYLDPETGMPFSKETGEMAGTLSGAYISVAVQGYRGIRAHRLTWALHHGYHVPDGWEIDHIDHNKTDNRLINLRLARHSNNQADRPLTKANTSGHKGISRGIRKDGTEYWVATVSHNKAVVFRKSFDLKQDAIDAACAAREQYHGRFANHGVDA